VFDLRSLPAAQRTFFAGAIALATRAFNFSRSVSQAPQRATPPIVFVEDRSFNARARTSAIGVHVAVPSILHFLFNQILCWPNVYPHIGTRASHRVNEYSSGLPWALPSTLSIADALVALPARSRPVDDQRAQAASAMTDIALTFCMYHEMCHVMFGHTGAHEAQFGTIDFLEFFSPESTEIPTYRIGQAWEYEADVNAAYMVTSSLLGDENRAHFGNMFQVDTTTGKYERAILSIWFTVLHALFLYLGQQPRRKPSRARHPHASVRSAYIFSELSPQLAFEDRTQLSSRALSRLELHACRTAERVWKQMRLTASTLTASQVESRIRRLKADLKVLRPTYRRYSWFGDAASVFREPFSRSGA
jgi:hypothetical protein